VRALLEEGGGRRHFMTRRFDRTEGGGKLHMQSLGGLQHFRIRENVGVQSKVLITE
jgi:serine/threonine protein kinase HipA of HipAB toxin-antitoxin module